MSTEVQVCGLSAPQLLILATVLNPDAMERQGYKNVDRDSLSKFLNMPPDTINRAINHPDFYIELHRICTIDMLMARRQIDAQLFRCAKDPDPRYNRDRNLFYMLIGALESKGVRPRKEEEFDRAKKVKEISRMLGIKEPKHGLEQSPHPTNP